MRTLWDNRYKIALGQDESAPIVVRALGDAGWRDLRERSGYAASLPRLAARALPSCWRGEALVDIPHLGGASSNEQRELDCRASFVSVGCTER
jgi:hypothetical protein